MWKHGVDADSSAASARTHSRSSIRPRTGGARIELELVHNHQGYGIPVAELSSVVPVDPSEMRLRAVLEEPSMTGGTKATPGTKLAERFQDAKKSGGVDQARRAPPPQQAEARGNSQL